MVIELIAGFHAALLAQRPPATGEWLIKQAGVALVCTLEQHGDALDGSCRPDTGPEGVPVAGTVRGRRVEWRFEIALAPDEPKQTATYTATLNEDGTKMSGTFSIAHRRGTFTGARQ